MRAGSQLCPQPRWPQGGRKFPHFGPPTPLFLPWRPCSRWWRGGGWGGGASSLHGREPARKPKPREGFGLGGGGVDMSLEDPFFVVRGEVQKAVNTARGLYQRWCELLQEGAAVGREELDWTTNELRNGLRSIEWDLEDLEETIGIVESSPSKFKLPAGDLQERKEFVEQMREAVQEMKDHMVSPAAVAFMEKNNREMLVAKPATQKSPSDLLDASTVSATSRYIEEQQAMQQLIVDQQDQQLEMVSGSIQHAECVCSRDGPHPIPDGWGSQEDGQSFPHDE
ncbi:syntaxin-10 isoform X2 [Lemur catta]|uniref:syntaxin-10 isoform X2 n=1 Tax=Lemur catta TaxID=9447 RepID=UPI001E26B8CA|nr:syntaxin-10 isoform X2 [Lemur catta]